MSNNHINNLDEKIKRLEREKKALEFSLSKENRKKRTRRLIEIGALTQKYFDLDNNDIHEIEEILNQFSLYVKSNKLDKHKKKKE